MTISDERLAEMRKSLENHGSAKLASIYTSDYLYALTELQTLRAIPRGGVKVKGLEWDGQKAKTSLARYEVSKTPLGWIWTALLGDGIASRKNFPSEDEAKAAAQADYERRILSAIEQEQEPVAELTHDLGVWKLVPTRPTDRMIEAGKSADDEFLAEPPGFYAAEEIYKAMIEAAPKSPFKTDLLSPSVCKGKVTEDVPANDVRFKGKAAYARALDIADALIERAYGLDVPPEWNKAYRDVQKVASAALSQEGE